MKLTLSVDRTADLTDEMYEKYNLKTINMWINNIKIAGDTFRDSEVSAQDIYDAAEVRNLVPKTSAALESEYRELFESSTTDGGSIIHFSIGDKLSASHANAKRASQGLERVYVIDSKSVSVGTGLLAIKAHEMQQSGLPVEEIVKKCTEIAEKIDVSFIINDLKFLHRGGRVSGLKLLGANLLKIRPTLYIDHEGRLIPGKKFKGQFKKCVEEYADMKISQTQNVDKKIAMIASTVGTDEALAKYITNELKKAGFENIMEFKVGVTITTHCGRNTLGLVFLNN